MSLRRFTKEFTKLQNLNLTKIKFTKFKFLILEHINACNLINYSRKLTPRPQEL